jgi:Acetyltransferase (GNAT) family
MFVFRPALVQDVPLLRTLIHEFAEFERDHTHATNESLLRDGFGAKPMFRVFLAESDGEPAGYALFFDCYAPFQGPGIYLEDIFIRPQFRNISGRHKGLLNGRKGVYAKRPRSCQRNLEYMSALLSQSQ